MKDTEKRVVARRYRRRVEVRYGPRAPEHTGYSGNISRTGIMIRTTRVYGSGSILHLELKFPQKTIKARAQVTWAREGTMLLLPSGRVGMGLKFIDPPQELLEHLETFGFS